MSRIKPMYDGIRLNVAITSDNHVDTNVKSNKQRMKTIRTALKDCEKSTERFDAYITVGDTTSRGLTENWEKVKECFNGMSPAKQIFFTLGNHDSWSRNGYEGYFDGIKNYYKYSDEICSNKIDRPYFSRTINGYHFIFLGTDGIPENEDCASLSAEQLEWFAAEMDEAGKNGKPIFVFCHQSVNGHHGLPRTWDGNEDPTWGPEIGGIGTESEAVEEILKKHRNVYYFSGHSHMALNGEEDRKVKGFASFEEYDGVNYINLPCLTRPNHHGGNEKTGQGVVLEVYDGKVVIRPRNFRTHRMNKKIAIKDGKPYLEEKIK